MNKEFVPDNRVVRAKASKSDALCPVCKQHLIFATYINLYLQQKVLRIHSQHLIFVCLSLFIESLDKVNYTA